MSLSAISLSPTEAAFTTGVGTDGEWACYQFYAHAGEYIEVAVTSWELSDTLSFNQPMVTLRLPDGTDSGSEISTLSGFFGGRWLLPQTGTYRLQFRTSNDSGTFTMDAHAWKDTQIRLDSIVPMHDSHIDLTTAGRPAYFFLNGHNGSQLTVVRTDGSQWNDIGPWAWAELHLYRPNGTELANTTLTNGSDSSWGPLDLDAEGIWVVEASASARYAASATMTISFTGSGFDPWITYFDPTGIESDETVGSPSLISSHAFIRPSSIAPLAAVGRPHLSGERIRPLGIPSLAQVGKPSIVPNPIFPVGIPSAEHVGKPWLHTAGVAKIIFPAAWADPEAVGEPSLVDAGPATIYPVGIA